MTASDPQATPAGDSAVAIEQQDRVLAVTLAHPPANALGAPIVEGLTKAVEAFETGDAKAAVIASSLSGFFAAGADIKLMSTLDGNSFAGYRDRLRAPLERLATCGKPSIAAIDGRALGGGLELAMACTLRFATPASRLGLPEVKLGLLPGAGGTQRLPLLVGRGRALEIMLSGREVEADEAAAIGLVDRVVDGDVVAEATAYAQRLAQLSAPAMAAIIACVDAAATPSAEGMRTEGDAVVRLLDEGEGHEGLAAFVEKRRPDFA